MGPVDVRTKQGCVVADKDSVVASTPIRRPKFPNSLAPGYQAQGWPVIFRPALDTSVRKLQAPT